MDVTDPCPAVDELRREQRRVTADVVMRFGGRIDPVSEGPRQGDAAPDESFWRVYRATRTEFGEPFDDIVVDQLVARDRDISFRPACGSSPGCSTARIAGSRPLIEIAGAAYVDNVVTRPPFRRRGVASATVMRAVAAAHERGVETVFLLADDGGDPQRLYERLGFRVVRRAMGFTRPLPG